MSQDTHRRLYRLTERRLTAVWAEVLDAGPISTTDDFFDCGGHSLTALELARRVHTVFGIKLGLSDIFRHRTVAAQAALLHRLAVQSLEISLDHDGARFNPEEVDEMGSELLRILWSLAEDLDPARVTP